MDCLKSVSHINCDTFYSNARISVSPRPVSHTAEKLLLITISQEGCNFKMCPKKKAYTTKKIGVSCTYQDTQIPVTPFS